MTRKGSELLSRARELVPVLRARATDAEKLRSIPPETSPTCAGPVSSARCSRRFSAGTSCRSTKPLWDLGVLSAAYLAASLWLVQAAWPWL